MNVSAISGDAGSAMLALPRVLDLAAAPDLHRMMLDTLGAAKGMRLDASQVDLIQLPCMQLILSAMRSAPGVTIEQPSPAFASAFQDLALDWTAQVFEPGFDAAPAIPAAAPAAAAEVSQVPVETTSMRILTIDDSKTMRDMLMLTLADAGFDVLQAVDGQEGVDLLEKETVDIVITDINMPRMDGYEVIRQLRARPEHQHTPILVLTTESEREKKNVGRDVGATGWIVKPFDPDRLIETVRKVAR